MACRRRDMAVVTTCQSQVPSPLSNITPSILGRQAPQPPINILHSCSLPNKAKSPAPTSDGIFLSQHHSMLAKSANLRLNTLLIDVKDAQLDVTDIQRFLKLSIPISSPKIHINNMQHFVSFFLLFLGDPFQPWPGTATGHFMLHCTTMFIMCVASLMLIAFSSSLVGGGQLTSSQATFQLLTNRCPTQLQ